MKPQHQFNQPAGSVRPSDNVVGQAPTWSIGIYTGADPMRLATPRGRSNPVLRIADVSDITAGLVADPFLQRADDGWSMFFETTNRQRRKGEIGMATSDNGLDWSYQQIVLAEPFHLSYPHVFAADGVHYMIPETLGAGAVQLYQAQEFPREWTCVGRLIEGLHADPTPFRAAGHWWLYTCSPPRENATLHLFYADELLGPWREHPLSPVVQDDCRTARPAGRVFVEDGRPIRFAQDCHPHYGRQTRAFVITDLTPTTYAEIEHPASPVLTPAGSGWNGKSMHHIDIQQLADGSYLACVDGFAR